MTRMILVASNNSMASRDSDGGSDGGDHSVMDHQIQEVSYYKKLSNWQDSEMSGHACPKYFRVRGFRTCPCPSPCPKSQRISCSCPFIPGKKSQF